MGDSFEPELGQFCFSNGTYFGCEMDIKVEDFLYELGEYLETNKLTHYNPCRDTGDSFENDTFAIQAYCWCDGDKRVTKRVVRQILFLSLLALCVRGTNTVVEVLHKIGLSTEKN